MRFRLWPAIAALVLISGPVLAQETTPEEPKQPAAEPSTPADESSAPADQPAADASFSELFAKWQEIVAQMRDLQVQYQRASAQERPDLEAKFIELAPQAEALVPQLLDAAQKEYQANPNQDQNVADFLASSVGMMRSRDDNERGLEIAKLLIDNKYPNPAIYNVAGVAAYGANEFETAKEYLEQAKQSNALDAMGNQCLESVDEQVELWKAEQALREAEAQADDLPRVLLKTNQGDITFELFENEAPNTVANFIDLVDSKFYDGVPFHRVLHNFMAQTGDPKGNGTGGPGYHIPCECYSEDARNHFSGSLSMAHAGRDTGGSQFFITFVPTPHLNGKHTVFGRVVDGFDVLTELQQRSPMRPGAAPPDRITEATVIRKRDHEYKPQTLPESTPGG